MASAGNGGGRVPDHECTRIAGFARDDNKGQQVRKLIYSCLFVCIRGSQLLFDLKQKKARQWCLAGF
jgi:hypothetical protein